MAEGLGQPSLALIFGRATGSDPITSGSLTLSVKLAVPDEVNGVGAEGGLGGEGERAVV